LLKPARGVILARNRPVSGECRLKSHLASICFPAWCLGHDPNAQILCPSYVQDLADKLSRDCRRILANDWYRQVCAKLRIRRSGISD